MWRYSIPNLVMAGSHELCDLLGFSLETEERQMLIFSHIPFIYQSAEVQT